MTRKMKFYNFGLEQKLDHYSRVEFHPEFDNNGFNFLRLQLTQYASLVPPKMKFLNLGLRKKHSNVEFNSDSDNDGFKV